MHNITAPLLEPVDQPFEPAAPRALLTAFNEEGIGWVPCAPFPCSFVFFQLDDEHERSDLAILRDLLPDFNPSQKCNGCTSEYFADTGEYLILIGWRLNSYAGGTVLPLIDRVAILVHEIHHAINFVLQHTHQRPDADNDEITAYLHEYHTKAALLAVGFGESDKWRTNTEI